MHILVTGGAGFIGSHIVNYYLSVSCRVTIIDNLCTGRKDNISPKAFFINKDITEDGWTDLLPKDITHVIHLAAQSSGEISFEDPLYDIRTNAVATLELLNWSLKNKVQKFIFASSMNIYGDVNDDIFCESNILDACDLCDGSNEDKSYCENASFVDQVGCETAGSIWNTFFDGPEVDCFGTCNAVDSLQAATDECSSVSQPKCCGGNTGIECSYYIDTNNFGGDYDCLGECNGASIVDECGVCNGNSNLDAKGNCIFLLYPGDTDMDGSVNLNDINPIVKFWGRLVDQRTNFDVDGNILSSKSNWFAQSHSILGDRGKIAERECILYADANGDGRVNISDITTIIKNLNKSHSSPTSTDCSALSRTSDVEMYFSIFKSLPNGELKRSMADMYGFEMPPESFFVHPNYPNPFNPITTIKYEVPDKGSVLIAVFNLRGQRIHEYTNVVNSPGSYLMTWDASNYSTGIYYSSVYYNGELIENMKMIYLK